MTKSRNIIVIFLLPALMACKPTVPGRYIQPDDFEDILYDYNIAMSIVEESEDGQDPHKTEKMHLYKLAVMKKHGVSVDEFDESLVYYTRHSDRLYDMYKNIAERMEARALSLGADVREIKSYGATVATTDTANIWPMESHAVLTSTPPNNTLSYSVAVDTSYHKGDRLIWSFNTKFLYRQGRKEAVALMSVKFDNDSVTTRSKRLSSSTHYSLDINLRDTVMPKSVSGFVCLTRQADASDEGLKLLFLNDIKLVKMTPSSSGDNKTEQERNSVASTKEKTETIDTAGRRTAADTIATVPVKPVPKPLIKKP